MGCVVFICCVARVSDSTRRVSRCCACAEGDEDIKAECGTAINLKRWDGLSSVTSPTLPMKFH